MLLKVYDEEQIKSMSNLLNIKDKTRNDKIIIYNKIYKVLKEYVSK